MSAPGNQAVEEILNNAGDQINENLFQSCRAAAQALLGKTRYPEAIRGFEATLAVASRLHSPADIGEAYRGIGIGYRFLGQYAVAMQNYDKALQAAETSGSKPLIASVLRARGVSLRALGRDNEAIEADERCIAIYRELNDPANVARAISNLAVSYTNLGDLRRAAGLIEEALQIDRTPAFADFLNNNLAAIEAERGNAEVARAYLEKSIHGAEQRQASGEAANAIFNLAEIDASTGHLDRALAEFDRVLSLAHEMHNQSLEDKTLINRADAYARQNRPEPATADLRRSIADLEKVGDEKTLGLALVSLARLATQRGDVAEARLEIERALDIGRRIQWHELLWQANLVSAEVSLAGNDRAQARQHFVESIREVELLRDLAGGDEQTLASFLTSDRIRPYQEMLSLLVETRDNEAALAIAERARARQLVDAVRFGRTEPHAAMSPAERAEELRLSQELVRLDRRLAAADQTHQDAARAEWRAAQLRLEEFRAHLYDAHPGLAAQRGDAVPITLAECADLLPHSRTALLEFAVTEKAVYVFTITRGASGEPAMTVHVEPISRETLAQQVGAFRDLLAARSFQYREPATALYRRLLAPVAAQLRGRTVLVIVPDGVLWDLPFQALIDPEGAHLIERHTIFYAPSLTWLRDRRRLEPSERPAKLLLALGNPGSANLASSEREVRGLSVIYGTNNVLTLTGPAATREAWVRQAPQYRILHLATHGILNSDSPVYSWLALAPAHAGGPDDVLEAREVLGLNLHADLAVLSACDTARGEVAPGEGLIGMSWAFLTAGVASTVVSQWAVDTASTTELMLAFHKNLKPALDSGSGRARSLRAAALSVMRRPGLRHPYYWAGFVEVGDGY